MKSTICRTSLIVLSHRGNKDDISHTSVVCSLVCRFEKKLQRSSFYFILYFYFIYLFIFHSWAIRRHDIMSAISGLNVILAAYNDTETL